MFSTFLAGFFTSLSLIAAIGAQNAFILRQGLRREHVLACVLACALSDATLIAVGVGGIGKISEIAPWFTKVMLYGGAAFLLIYGGLRFKAALRGGAALLPSQAGSASLGATLLPLLLLTWANPHVYLDTVILLGSISSGYAPDHWIFGAGAMMASFAFFFGLGFGARLLAPVFASPRAWVVLELVVGLTMWLIAASLIWKA